VNWTVTRKAWSDWGGAYDVNTQTSWFRTGAFASDTLLPSTTTKLSNDNCRKTYWGD